MAELPKVRKPPRVVFSLGVPLPVERAAAKMAKKARITRNAYIVRALEAQIARDEAAPEPLRAAS